MEERLDPKFDTALEELYSYFSDNLAPLLVAGSIEELFSHPEVIATGIRTVFVPRTRALHRRLALTAVVLMVITAVTGTIMILNAVRIAPAGE